MADYINKKELEKIVQYAPSDVSKQSILQGLASKGYIIQGYNEEKKSFLGGLVKGMAEPFVRGANLLSTAGPVIGATMSSIPASLGLGSKEKARERLDKVAYKAEEKQRTTIKTPIGEYNPITSSREATGTAVEMVGWLVGGGGAKQVGKELIRNRLLKAMGKGATTGLASGTIFGVGSSLGRGESGGEVATSGLIGGAMGAGIGTALGGLGVGGRAVYNKLTQKLKPVAQQVKEKVVGYIGKSIKPRMTNMNVNQLKKVQDKQVQAFQVLVKNKNKIKLPDEAGQSVNRFPKTVSELSDAITQVKTWLFDRYDRLAIKSGESGANFNPIKTLGELKKASKSKANSIQVRNYIKRMVSEVKELKGESPSVVQSRIKELNESLAGFYSGRINKSKARVDASVAKLLREELDDVIHNFTGGHWKQLRSEFSALKTIEKDVNKQALVMLRKNTKGLTDLTDVFTGGDLVSGLITANPQSTAKGLIGKGIQMAYKYLNDPNRYIRKIFEELEKVAK